MSDVQSPNLAEGRCDRCGASLAASERFCAVCGASREEATRPPAARRGVTLLLGSAAILLLVFAGVAWIYFSAPDRQAARPLSQLPAGVPSAAAIVGGTAPSLLAADGGQLLSSRDGQAWQAVQLDGPVSAIGTTAGNPPLIYLAGGRFWRSAEAGFASVPTDLPAKSARALAVDPADPRRVYALVAGPALLQSSDGGAHWTSLGADLPSGVDSLALGAGGGPAFFVGTAGLGIFASLDGHTWSNASGFVNGALPSRNVSAVAFDPLSGDRYVSPQGQASSGALFAGTDQGIFKSIDGGLSWGPLPLHQPIVALAVDPRGTHLMLAIDSAGNVYKSSDEGNSW